MIKYRIKAVKYHNNNIDYFFQKRVFLRWVDMTITPKNNLDDAKVILEKLRLKQETFIY